MHFFVAKLLSIAVMTYTDVYHPRNLRQMIRLIFYAQANKLQHATAARAHGARPHCRLISPFYRTPANTRKNVLSETRVPELHGSFYGTGLTVSTFTQLFTKAKKMFKTSVNARPHCSLTSYFLENPTEYPQKPYITRN